MEGYKIKTIAEQTQKISLMDLRIVSKTGKTFLTVFIA